MVIPLELACVWDICINISSNLFFVYWMTFIQTHEGVPCDRIVNFGVCGFKNSLQFSVVPIKDRASGVQHIHSLDIFFF